MSTEKSFTFKNLVLLVLTRISLKARRILDIRKLLDSYDFKKFQLGQNSQNFSLVVSDLFLNVFCLKSILFNSWDEFFVK